MVKEKGLPDTIKLKIRLEVDRTLYDRIVAQAKAENLSGTVEGVLKGCCEGWFKGWKDIFAAKDNADEVTKGPKLVGLDGKPLITTPGGEA